MKKIILFIILLVGAKSFAQTNGITYQAVILNPTGEQLPGVNNSNAPMVGKNICLQFQFIDEFSKLEYQETIQIKTDAFGMVNLVIGSGNQTAGYAASFQTIEWNSLKKSLVVSISTKGSCSSFTEISNQPFTAVPFAFSAINAGNVTGVVAIENGGTNAVTVLGAKKNLGIENVANTTDLNKPISSATQLALNVKEDLINKSTNVVVDGFSDTKYPTVKALKTYVDVNASTASSALVTEVNRAITAEGTLSTNLGAETTRATTVETGLTTNLASEGTVRGAADLVLTNGISTLTTGLSTEVTNRTNVDLLKENLVNKSVNVLTDAASDTMYPSVKATKTYVDGVAVANTTALMAEISRATTAEGTLTKNLGAETTRATAAETGLTTNLASEATTRGAADLVLTNGVSTLTTGLSTEVTNRTNADIILTNGLAAEATIARAAELDNATAITLEATTARAAELTNATTITSEATTARTAELANATAITLEATTARAAELANATAITSEATTARISELANATAITLEATTARAAELTNATTITSEATIARAAELANATAITLEATTARAAELANSNEITSEATTARVAELGNATAIISEATTARAAELANATATTLEATTARAGELANFNAITSEATTARAAELANATAIISEATTSRSAELSNLNAITSEATTRTNADTLLQTNINTLGTTVTVNITAAANAIALKADIASPTFTGILTVPTLVAGTNTYPNTNGTRGQVLSTNGSGAVSWSTPAASGVPYTGATASVDLGAHDLTINGMTIGLGSGQAYTNTAFGKQALWANNTGVENTAIGSNTILFNTSGSDNTASGYQALQSNTTGNGNTAYGVAALITNTTGNNLTAIGTGANVTADGLTNATAIGYGANVSTSNTIQLGNTSVTKVNTNGQIIAAGFKTPTGAATEFLKADGSVDLNTYAQTSNVDAKENKSNKSADGNLGTSDDLFPTQNATKTYVDNKASSSNFVDLTTDQTVAGNKTFNNNVQFLDAFQISDDGKYSYPIKYERLGTDFARLGFGFRGNAFRTTVNQNSGLLEKLTYSYFNSASSTDVEAMHIDYNSRVTIGGVMYPNTSGSANQVLTTDGSGIATWATVGNTAITGATKTKVTYDAKGLVIAGADATTADIAASANKNYVTDAQLTIIAATSGTNTGDQNLSSYATNSDLALKVNIASPTFTGTPTLPPSTIGVTQTSGDNSTKLATTAYVATAVSAATSGIASTQWTTVTNDIYYNIGNVGVGTSSPTSKLQVVGGGRNNMLRIESDDNASLTLKNTSADAGGGEYEMFVSSSTSNSSLAAGSLAIYYDHPSDAGYRFSINTAGNVGIGTGTPTEKLDVIGNVKTSGTLTAGAVTYPNTHNSTAGQVLTTNASGVGSWATPSVGGATVADATDEFSALPTQTVFTLTRIPAATSKVKMYINGIRVSNAAYSISSATLTYDPVLNGAYSVTVNDRVQFDYSY